MLVSLPSSSSPLPASLFCITWLSFTFHLNSLSSVSNRFPSCGRKGEGMIALLFTNWNQGGSFCLLPSAERTQDSVAGSVTDAFHPCSAPGLTVLSVSRGADSSSKNYKEGWRLGTQQMQKELRPENKPWRRWTSQPHCRLCLLRALVSTSLVCQDAQS